MCGTKHLDAFLNYTRPCEVRCPRACKT